MKIKDNLVNDYYENVKTAKDLAVLLSTTGYDYDFLWKGVDYWIKKEFFRGKNFGKPFISYYLLKDHSDEHITYFSTFEEMFINYKMLDGTILIDVLCKYGIDDWA